MNQNPNDFFRRNAAALVHMIVAIPAATCGIIWMLTGDPWTGAAITFSAAALLLLASAVDHHDREELK